MPRPQRTKVTIGSEAAAAISTHVKDGFNGMPQSIFQRSKPNQKSAATSQSRNQRQVSTEQENLSKKRKRVDNTPIRASKRLSLDAEENSSKASPVATRSLRQSARTSRQPEPLQPRSTNLLSQTTGRDEDEESFQPQAQSTPQRTRRSNAPSAIVGLEADNETEFSQQDIVEAPLAPTLAQATHSADADSAIEDCDDDDNELPIVDGNSHLVQNGHDPEIYALPHGSSSDEDINRPDEQRSETITYQLHASSSRHSPILHRSQRRHTDASGIRRRGDTSSSHTLSEYTTRKTAPTADLQRLLPRRRTKAEREHRSSDADLSPVELDDEQDDHLAASIRSRKGKSVAKAHGPNSKARHSARDVGSKPKTYGGSNQQGEEYEEDSEASEDEAAAPEPESFTEERVLQRPEVEKFKEVDEWDLEFEEVTLDTSGLWE
jgi:hypothetical protein